MQYASDLALAVAPPPAALPLRWQAPPPPAGSPRPPHTPGPAYSGRARVRGSLCPIPLCRVSFPAPSTPRRHRPSTPPATSRRRRHPRLHPSPVGPVGTRACLSVGHTYSYLLLRESPPPSPPPHTLSVTSPAMSCNVHAVWTSEQSHSRTSLNAAHSAYILVSPTERAPPRVTCLAMSCNVHDVCSTCSHAAIPLSLPPTQSPVPPPGREGSLPLSATHYATCNTLHAICENGPAPPPPA